MACFIPEKEDTYVALATPQSDEEALRTARLLSLSQQFAKAYCFLEPLRLRCKSRIRREVVDTAVTVLARLDRHDLVSDWLAAETDGTSRDAEAKHKWEFSDVAQRCYVLGPSGANDAFPHLAREIVMKHRCPVKWRALEQLLRWKAAMNESAGQQIVTTPTEPKVASNEEQECKVISASVFCLLVADYISNAVVRSLELRDRPTNSIQHVFNSRGGELNSVPTIPVSSSAQLEAAFAVIFGSLRVEGSPDSAAGCHTAALCKLLTKPVWVVFGGRGP
jgi:hypothetical protein